MLPSPTLSKFDEKRGLRFPTTLDRDLAYFIGVLAGDGALVSRRKKNGTDYEVKCVGNPKDEKPFYNEVLIPLIKKLFNLDILPHLVDGGTTYGFRIWSKSLVQFLVGVGLPCGRKYEKLRIPQAIKEERPLLPAFIAGLADTDFCVALKRRGKNIQYYPVIELNTASKHIIQEVAEALHEEGFTYSLCLDLSFYDKRIEKEVISHHLCVYGLRNLGLWLEKIGFRNQKHLAKAKLAFERNKKKVAGTRFELMTFGL
ncbi:MAG: hypothetical protein KAW41_01875 [Candidatus Diapherotrites archaeon]|nr:hypothetical protein [Candidatus Diapherotrites archaeon]